MQSFSSQDNRYDSESVWTSIIMRLGLAQVASMQVKPGRLRLCETITARHRYIDTGVCPD